jgi:eukaryotic-like serine/threonine-protein kinase
MAESIVTGTAEWTVPGYTTVRELGSGGFGDVVLARHDATGMLVAIKYLKAELLDDPGFATMFRTEAEVLAQLDDPNVVRLYEYVESPAGAAIVMELVDGASLRLILAHQGQTTPQAALVVLLGSLLGLAAAHRRGIVHRDYKPENVLVNGGGVSKLTDFGIAVRTGDQPYAGGTVAYAAPEQMGGGPATPAADVYAATATFYECLTGRPPFTGETAERVMYQHLFEPVPLEPVPVPLRPLVEAGMAKEPDRRPTDGTTFIASLRAAAAGAYGPDWEEHGRSHLGEAALLLAALWPLGASPAVQGAAVQNVQLTQQGTRESRHLRHLWHLKHLAHLAHLAHLRRLYRARAILAATAGTALVVAAGLYASNLSFNTSAPPHPGPTPTRPVTLRTAPPPPQTLSTGPAVTGLFPASGSAGGGTLVTITGTRLDGSGSAGGGTALTITGTRPDGPVYVKFGAKYGTIKIDLNTKIVVKSPPGHGTVEITVITPGGTSQVGEFSYHPVKVHVKAPAVTGVFPATGPAAGGTPVTITGTRLADASTVSFGGAAGTITSDSATEITVTSPPGHGPADVTVTTPGGTSTAGTFSYSAPRHTRHTRHTRPARTRRTWYPPASSPARPAHSTPPPLARPVITGITPDDGPMAGGTSVSITGSGLANASTVSFGGAAGTITSDSGSRITVTSPPGLGVARVTVTTGGGTATGTFTYNLKISHPTPTPVVTVSPAPVIFAVYPRSGPTSGGTPVTITGRNLSGATVRFGGLDGAVSADSSTEITVISPADASDYTLNIPIVNITVATAGGTVSAGIFTYVAPLPPPKLAPAITSISPASAGESTTITLYIYGMNLSGATSVSFGTEGNGAIISVSSTEIEVTAPEFCGTVNVTVTTPGGTATSPDQFSETCPTAVPVSVEG